MQVSYATESSPGESGDDYVAVGPDWALVLDGATAPPGVNTGCVHNVRWYVHHLGAMLAKELTSGEQASLKGSLATAIQAVSDAHRNECDLSNPNSPSSTVALLRHAGEDVEVLVLADSPVLLDVNGEVRVVEDTRIDPIE